jgi:hypothetical protein
VRKFARQRALYARERLCHAMPHDKVSDGNDIFAVRVAKVARQRRCCRASQVGAWQRARHDNAQSLCCAPILCRGLRGSIAVHPRSAHDKGRGTECLGRSVGPLPCSFLCRVLSSIVTMIRVITVRLCLSLPCVSTRQSPYGGVKSCVPRWCGILYHDPYLQGYKETCLSKKRSTRNVWLARPRRSSRGAGSRGPPAAPILDVGVAALAVTAPSEQRVLKQAALAERPPAGARHA